MNAVATRPTVGDDGMATLRLRIDALKEKRESRYPSVEAFIREARISRTAWQGLVDPKRQEVNLRVLATVMQKLDMSPDETLEFIPDDQSS